MGGVASGTQCQGADGAAVIVAWNSAAATSSPSSGSGSTTPATSPSTDNATGSTPNKPSADGSCNGAPMGSIKCMNGGTAWAICNWSSWVSFGSVAAGTKCVGADGQGVIVAA